MAKKATPQQQSKDLGSEDQAPYTSEPINPASDAPPPDHPPPVQGGFKAPEWSVTPTSPEAGHHDPMARDFMVFPLGGGFVAIRVLGSCPGRTVEASNAAKAKIAETIAHAFTDLGMTEDGLTDDERAETQF